MAATSSRGGETAKSPAKAVKPDPAVADSGGRASRTLLAHNLNQLAAKHGKETAKSHGSGSHCGRGWRVQPRCAHVETAAKPSQAQRLGGASGRNGDIAADGQAQVLKVRRGGAGSRMRRSMRRSETKSSMAGQDAQMLKAHSLGDPKGRQRVDELWQAHQALSKRFRRDLPGNLDAWYKLTHMSNAVEEFVQFLKESSHILDNEEKENWDRQHCDRCLEYFRHIIFTWLQRATSTTSD